jgi:cellulose synthase/poly-beta-1,6-N-acetylglucosamine synthase-like glycosyltransferase
MEVWLIVVGFLFGLDLCIQLSIATAFKSNSQHALNQDIGDWPSAAVLVVVKDEAQNLPAFLKALKSQDLPVKFVLIDDHSSDESLLIMQRAQMEDDRFEVQSATSHQGKKEILHHAVMARNEEFILLTDADCILHGQFWAKTFLQAMVVAHADFGVGSGLIYPGRSWWTRWQSQQNLRMHQLFHAAIHWKIPYMAVGRSIAIRTKAFKEVNGMLHHIDLKGGTDDLLLQDFVRMGKKVISVPQATTWSEAPATFKGLIAQRNRHLSAGFRYPAFATFLVFAFEILALALPIGVLFISFFFKTWILALLALTVYFAAAFLHDLNASIYLTKATGNDVSNNLWLRNAWVSAINALTSMVAFCVKPTQWTKRK